MLEDVIRCARAPSRAPLPLTEPYQGGGLCQ